MQVLPIVAERSAEARAFEVAGGLAFIDRIAGAGELAAHNLPHPLLQIGEAVEAEAIGEAHDGRGIDVELARHLVDGRERHRLRMLDDVFGDTLLRLREPVVAAAQLIDHVGADLVGRLFDSGFRHRASPFSA